MNLGEGRKLPDKNRNRWKLFGCAKGSGNAGLRSSSTLLFDENAAVEMTKRTKFPSTPRNVHVILDNHHLY